MQINNILIVGTGNIGRRHYHLATKLVPEALVYVLTRNKSAKEKSYVPFENQVSYEESLEIHPQIAVLANPSSLHLEYAKKFMYLGAHLLIEKPISNKVCGVFNLIKHANSMSKTLMVGYNLRFLPSLNKFRDLIRFNEIGKIISVQGVVGQNLMKWRVEKDYRESVSAKHELGGGVLLELSHEIDYIRWIFGEIESVYGLLGKLSKLEINVEDSAQILLEFASDNQGSKLVGNLSMDFIRHDPVRQCIAVGERGSLRWNGIVGTVEKWLPEEGVWNNVCEFSNEIDDSYLAEWINFLDSVNNKDYPKVTGMDALKVMQIIEAVRDSSKSGTKVNISKYI